MQTITRGKLVNALIAIALGLLLGSLAGCLSSSNDGTSTGGSGAGNDPLSGTMLTSTVDSGLTVTIGMPSGDISKPAGNPITLSTAPSATQQTGTYVRVGAGDPSISYSGNWVSEQMPSEIGTSLVMESVQPGARILYTFTGTAIRWIGYRDAWSGVADVYLDGMHVATVDTYSTISREGVVLYSATGLAGNVNHTLAIQVAGKQDPAGLGSTVSASAFDVQLSQKVTASASAPVSQASSGGFTRIEQGDAAVSYSGSWTTESSSLTADFSGGSAAESFQGGASATLSFDGTAVRWRGYSDTFSGIADVFLDGSHVATVDTYSLLPESQVVMYSTSGLASGSHTLTIRPEGQHRLLALGSAVWVDAFDVQEPPADTTPPTITMTAPGNGATVSGSVTVAANASDNVGVTSVQFELDGANLGAPLTDSPYSISWDSTSVSNGSHTLTAVARDAAGNQTTAAPVTVTVSNNGGGGGDSTPPTVSMTAPANGSNVSGSITVSADASDNVGVVGVQFMLDGAPLGPEKTSAPYSVVWDTTTASNGGHTLTAVARDAAGNKGTAAPVTVSVSNSVGDTTPPTVNMTAPVNGADVSGNITVSADASDNVGVVGVQFELDGSPLGAEETNAPYSVAWDSTTAANGSHTLTAVARDAAGNKGTATPVTVTVSNSTSDTTPPTVNMTAPTNGAAVSGRATVSADASDNVGVVGVQFELDGAPLGAELTHSPYSISWDSTTTSNGSHSLTAVARDAAGNKSTATPVTVSVSNSTGDTTPPTVSMTAPANGATVSGSVTVSANASDNVGVAGVQFMLDGAPLGAEDTAAPYSISWNSTAVPNGSHTLTAVARDAAGNKGSATPVTVTVSNSGGGGDTTPPTASMTAPANGTTVSGSVAVSANASDNVGVVGVQFMLDGAPLGAEDTTSPYSISWNSTAAPNGSHTLSAVARDAAGNKGSATPVTVTVSNGGGGGTTTRFEQDNPAIAYTGTWITASDSRVSGGTAVETNQTGATATLTFTGTAVTWISYTSPDTAGIASVSVDGGPATQVDTYTATVTPQAKVYTASGLAKGTHTLKITVSGNFDRSGNSAYVVVDAFDVTN